MGREADDGGPGEGHTEEAGREGETESGAGVGDLLAADRLDGVTIVMSGAEHSSDALAAAALEALDRGGAPAPFGTWRCPAAYGKCACRSS